jgi:hypothetical protein
MAANGKQRRPANPAPLTRDELMIFAGIRAREQLAHREIQDDIAYAMRSVERRLRLKAGAIPATHAIDFDAGTVVRKESGQ